MLDLGRLAREPLCHFAALGAALFAIYRAVGPAPPGRTITVDAALRARLGAEVARRTGAPADPAEQARAVERYLDQEVLYREALALGLDRGDVIVRRRLVQKMQLLLEDEHPLPEPDERALSAWLAAHPERAGEVTRLSLAHVFVADRDPARARALRTQLERGADPGTLGDPFLDGHALRGRTPRELAARFGAPFAHAVEALAPNTWSEPIASAFGLHLVRVSAVEHARPPASELRRAWLTDERARRDRAALAELRARYRVEVRP